VIAIWLTHTGTSDSAQKDRSGGRNLSGQDTETCSVVLIWGIGSRISSVIRKDDYFSRHDSEQICKNVTIRAASIFFCKSPKKNAKDLTLFSSWLLITTRRCWAMIGLQ